MFGLWSINVLYQYDNCTTSLTFDFYLNIKCDINNGPITLTSLTDTNFDYNFFDDTTIETNFTFPHYVCGTPTI